ncbi:hypothetical protein QBC44DRAFT_45574 [Cladorrhinum sp. PSN332]|nr:hypothetical protein QBC44DRAFT_45574 [Cladorrhinum sp. PSN332]
MDPASITGLVASCFSLLATTAKTLKGLHDLKSKYAEVETDVSHILARISTIQTSVQVLQRWIDTGPAALHSNDQLRTTIDQALDDCVVVVSAIEKHLGRIKYSAGLMPASGKIRHLWNEDEVAKNERGLGYQVQALTLLLQAIQMTSVVEQQRLISKDGNRKVLRRARDDASSYVDLTDEQLSMLQGTVASETTGMDTMFDFDDLTLDSHAYRAAFRSLLRKNQESKGKPPAAPSPTPADTQTIDTSSDSNLTEMGVVSEPPYLSTSPGGHPVSPSTDFDSQLAMNVGIAAHSAPGARDTSPGPPETMTPTILNVKNEMTLSQLEFDVQADLAGQGVPIGVWRFHIKAAQGLQSGGLINRKPNTYICITAYDLTKVRTSVCQGNRNPQYDAVIYVPCMRETGIVYLQVMDARTLGGERELGMIEIDTSAFIKRDPHTGEYQAHDLKQLRSEGLRLFGKPNGILKYEVAFFPRIDAIITPSDHRMLTSSNTDDKIESQTTRLSLDKMHKNGLDSGLLMFTLSLESLYWNPRKMHKPLSLYIFIDDVPYPFYKCSLQADEGDYKKIGLVFIRELDFSFVTFQIHQGPGFLVASAKMETLELLSSTLNKPTRIPMKKVADQTVMKGNFSRVTISTFYLPVRLQLGPRECVTNTGTVRVDVLSAAGIPTGETASAKAVSYAKFELNGKQIFRTTGERGMNPEWNQVFQLTTLSRISDDFRVQVFEGAGFLIGEAGMDMKDLEPFQPTECELNIDGRSAQVRLRLLFSPGYVRADDGP